MVRETLPDEGLQTGRQESDDESHGQEEEADKLKKRESGISGKNEVCVIRSRKKWT